MPEYYRLLAPLIKIDEKLAEMLTRIIRFCDRKNFRLDFLNKKSSMTKDFLLTSEVLYEFLNRDFVPSKT